MYTTSIYRYIREQCINYTQDHHEMSRPIQRPLYQYIAHSVALHPQGDIPDTPGARVRLLPTNSKTSKSLGCQTSQATERRGYKG